MNLVRFALPGVAVLALTCACTKEARRSSPEARASALSPTASCAERADLDAAADLSARDRANQLTEVRRRAEDAADDRGEVSVSYVTPEPLSTLLAQNQTST